MEPAIHTVPSTEVVLYAAAALSTFLDPTGDDV